MKTLTAVLSLLVSTSSLMATTEFMEKDVESVELPGGCFHCASEKGNLSANERRSLKYMQSAQNLVMLECLSSLSENHLKLIDKYVNLSAKFINGLVENAFIQEEEQDGVVFEEIEYDIDLPKVLNKLISLRLELVAAISKINKNAYPNVAKYIEKRIRKNIFLQKGLWSLPESQSKIDIGDDYEINLNTMINSQKEDTNKTIDQFMEENDVINTQKLLEDFSNYSKTSNK